MSSIHDNLIALKERMAKKSALNVIDLSPKTRSFSFKGKDHTFNTEAQVQESLYRELNSPWRPSPHFIEIEYELSGHKDYKQGIGFIDILSRLDNSVWVIEVKKNFFDLPSAIRQITFYKKSLETNKLLFDGIDNLKIKYFIASQGPLEAHQRSMVMSKGIGLMCYQENAWNFYECT